MQSKQKITLVTLDDRLKNVCQPIFAVAEHVLEDMQDFDMPNWDRNADSNSKEHVYNISVHYFEADGSIDDTSVLGNIYIPSNGKLGLRPIENVSFGNGGNPLLIMPKDDNAKNSLVKVLPKRNCSQFVKFWISNDTDIQNQILSDNRLKRQLQNVTIKHLGFDLTLYPEHIGNAYEINFNPIFRNIELRGEFKDATHYGVHLTFTFRGTGYHKLRARLLNYHHGDIIAEETEHAFTNDSSNQYIPLRTEPNILELFIYDADSSQLMYHLKDIVFIRGFQVSVNVASKEVHSRVRRKGKMIERTNTKFENETFGVRGEKTGNAQLFTLPLSFRTKSETIFVDGNPIRQEENKATMRKAISGILAKAQKECIICDPYFTASDFVEYVLPMPQLYVNLKIINSRECLASGNDKDKRLKDLSEVIREYNTKMESGRILCNSLTENIVHDRYILVDDNVWLLGASLSENGKRATTMVKIPIDKAKEIKEIITDWWHNHSKPINTDGTDKSQ